MALPMLRITVLVLAVLLLPAKSVAQADGPASAVAGARAQLNDAFARGDLATIATLLSSEVVMMSESGTWSSLEQVLGIHRSLVTRRPGITLESRPESIEIGPAKWSVASERGTWVERWMEDGKQNILEGTYQAMWRLQEGRWRLAAHLMVPNRCVGPYCRQ